MFLKGLGIRNTSQYNAVQLTTAIYYLINKHTAIIFVKVEFMLFHWIALNLTGVPIKWRPLFVRVLIQI